MGRLHQISRYLPPSELNLLLDKYWQSGDCILLLGDGQFLLVDAASCQLLNNYRIYILEQDMRLLDKPALPIDYHAINDHDWVRMCAEMDGVISW